MTQAKESWQEEPLTVFVFGASGDLAKKKTFPALLDLFVDGFLSDNTLICGYARSNLKQSEFVERLKPYLKGKGSEEQVNDFLKICIYKAGDYDSADAVKVASDDMTRLHGAPKIENRVFYFALPPDTFIATAASVKRSGLSKNGFNRVIVEKPFGHDTASAEKMSNDLTKIFDENHLYRIDHYLGKEMVQALLIMRFGNSWLEPLWNNNFIKAVIISFKEDIGTEGRGGYFDKSGIIRDIMQNHLMQVLSVVAMEPPNQVVGPGANDMIRDEKVKVLKAIKPWKLENTVLGQFQGYLDDTTVPKGSKCPTYAATVMTIDNRRWEGVPFIMKAGKGLDERRCEVRLQLKKPPGVQSLFGLDNDGTTPLNEIVLRIQPNEAIYVKTNIKSPGLGNSIMQSEVDLTYKQRYKNIKFPDAYTRLILDVLKGNQANFVRTDELLQAWKIATPLLQEIENKQVTPEEYAFGSRGPASADALVKKAGYVVDPNYSWI